MRVSIDVSPGEAIDKLSILMIKQRRIAAPDKLAHINREADVLAAVVSPLLAATPALAPLMAALEAVNEALWDVEDALREHEKQGRFDDAFIAHARSVYHTNDRRAALKAEINALLGTDIAEQKSYAA